MPSGQDVECVEIADLGGFGQPLVGFLAAAGLIEPLGQSHHREVVACFAEVAQQPFELLYAAASLLDLIDRG